jgi:hypothetical protein
MMLLNTVFHRESEIKIEMRKASFGGNRSEAGRYAANVRWQRQRGESKSETKGSLPLIFQPTWDETEAKKTGRPWAPLLEENYPPELQKAIRENISAWTEYYEAEISGAEKFKLADLNLKISKLEPIDPLLYQHLQSLKLSGDVLTASLFALSSKIWSEIQTNKSLITRKYDAERKIGSPFKPIEEYVNGKDMRVVVNVPPNVLSQILGDGRIKSQFETKTSKGILDTYARQTAETRMFGTHPEVSAKNRTIYGHVMNDGVDDSILKVAIHYGRVAIVLKKDVAERTTFTVGDSLMHGSTPSRISEPKDSSFIDSDAMYVEAQIHGQVKLSDIAYIVTGPDFISSGLQAKAQRLGIPVVLQDLTGGGTIPRPKFKIEETGDMTKTVGHLIAVRGDGHKLFHTHTETQPLSNMVMRLGFLEDENGERLDVNVDSALRYGYWEEPNSLADLIKASFGGDRSEAGRYAANIRWQGNVKGEEKGDNKKVIGLIPKNKYPVTADGAKHPKALKEEIQLEVGKLIPKGTSKSIAQRAITAKELVAKNISEAMADISTDDIKRAYREAILGEANLDNLNEKYTREEWISSLVGHWALTSNDGDEFSLAIQDTVAELFGLKKSLSWEKTNSLEGEVQETRDYQRTSSVFSPATQKALEAYVMAQYNATQQYLDAKGIKSLTVYRGMKFSDRDEMSQAGFTDLKEDSSTEDSTIVRQRPLSSWSLSSDEAASFAGYDNGRGNDTGVLIKTRVSATEIFSLPITGVGCLAEHEVVLLDAPKSVWFEGGREADFLHVPSLGSSRARIYNFEEKSEPAPKPKDS